MKFHLVITLLAVMLNILAYSFGMWNLLVGQSLLTCPLGMLLYYYTRKYK